MMSVHKAGGLAAAAGLSLMLVGGGLYASWSDGAQVTGGANVGTFACELSSTTPGAVISPDRKSVTYAEPAIQSSVVGDFATLSVDVTSVGTIPARVHWLYSTSIVPGGHWAVSEGTPSITTDVTLAVGEPKHYDDLGFVVSLLDNDDLGRVQSVTYTANCAEVPPPPTNVSVPDVVGLSEAAAVSSLTGVGLTLGVMTEAFSSAPVGHIVGQSPAAGASVPPGTAVDCVKSKGVELIAVPDVVGETYANAVNDVTGAGLTSGSRSDVYSDTVADGRVISTNPSAGAMVAPGTTVNYVVSKGAEPPPPPPVEFVGRTVGTQAATTITLPAGWQPGDLAIVMIMRNATTITPSAPAGYTGWAQATGGSSTSQVISRLAYKILQAGDSSTISTGTSYRAALVMVYRHAAPGVAVGNGSTSTTLTIPGLALQVTNGSSWVGAMATSFNGNREAAVPGMVNRTSGNGSSNGPGGFDTDGGVTAFASRTISSGQPWNAYSFELKRTP